MLDLGYRRALRPLLFRAASGDPERVHEQTLAALTRLERRPAAQALLRTLCSSPRRPVTVAGIDFPSPVGLAAGMDKDGVALRTWAALGFGHVEIGTVTARPQPGNSRPRLFRLPASGGLVNRMGFNNDGVAALVARLERAGVARGNRALGIVLGVSIGKNRTTPVAAATPDYLACFTAVAPYADYVAINVSSPNTPGLRALQEATALTGLLRSLTDAARTRDPENPVPIMVKVAPDLSEQALEELVEVCQTAGARGLVATNTTLAREGVTAAERWRAAESGGLSGAPLTLRTRAVVAFLAARSTLPVIGVGGVLSADDGRALLDAGAALLQVYTGLVYRGPALIGELNALSTNSRITSRRTP